MTKSSIVVSIAFACAAIVACSSESEGGRLSNSNADAGTGGSTTSTGGSGHTGGAAATGGSADTGGTGTGGSSTGGAATGGASADAGTDGASAGGAGTGGRNGTGGATVAHWACQQANTACLCLEAASSSDTCTLPKAKCCFTYTGVTGAGNCQCYDIDPASQQCTTLADGLRGTAVTTCPPP